jgi:monofunctional glycosyltransferase
VVASIRALRAVVTAAVLASLLLAGGVLWWSMPGREIGAWRQGPPPRPWAAWQRQETVWREQGLHRPIENSYVPLPAISVDLQLALLVGEDINFLGHGAFDFTAIREAIQEKERTGGRFRGASTITQQLAKTLFLSNQRTLWRKLREARLAWWLERRLGKRRILELYLNVVEFGPGILGAEAASRRYYGVAAGAIDASQAAGLAAAIPSPGRDNPDTSTPRWHARQALILRRMEHASWLRNLLISLDRSERD